LGERVLKVEKNPLKKTYLGTSSVQGRLHAQGCVGEENEKRDLERGLGGITKGSLSNVGGPGRKKRGTRTARGENPLQ